MGTDRANASTVTLAVAVVLAAGVGGAALQALPSEPTAVALECTVSGDRVSLTHRGGGTLDVRELRVELRIDGRPLAHQPPVPFFAATGFRGGPTGPFNAAAAPEWTAGETASLRVASTNEPTLDSGDRVTVDLYLDGRRVARARGTVTSGGDPTRARERRW